jgi:hypothetical protein
MGENFDQHSLVSTLLSGGGFHQWKKENQRTIEVQEELDRDLQVENADVLETLDVVLINCLFEDNKISAASDIAQSAVVAAIFPEDRLEIYGSIFKNNMYNLPEVQSSGSAVEAAGPITIENTRFLDNSFLKYAPVVLVSSQAVLTASGNSVNVIGDENLECDFAIQFPTIDAFLDNTNFECIALTAAASDAPSNAPTDAPSNAPVPTNAPVINSEPTIEPSKDPTIAPTIAPSNEPTIAPTIEPTTAAARFVPATTATTPQPTIVPTDASTTDAPTAGAAGRVIKSLSAAAVALTAYFVF